MEFQFKHFFKHIFFIHYDLFVCIKYVIFNGSIICFDNTNLWKYVTHFDVHILYVFNYFVYIYKICLDVV